MEHTHTKLELTDGVTRINKDILDFMQNGILDVHERLKDIEKWKHDETYEEMTVKMTLKNASPSGANVVYGTYVTDVQLEWEINQEVSSLMLEIPDENKTQINVLNKTSYRDTKSYLNVGAKTWTLRAKRADGDQEEKTVQIHITAYFPEYWGVGIDVPTGDNKDDKLEYYGQFIKNLSNYGMPTLDKHNLTFDGVDNQYLYYAIPVEEIGVKTPIFDIWENGYTDQFDQIDVEGQKNITVTIYDRNIQYYLFRSANLLKEEGKFTVSVRGA